MKKIAIVLAGMALLATPLAAQARPHGGGGFRGSVYGGPVFGGYRGYYGYPGYVGPVGLGFALGAALGDPWYYGPAYYGYYGYYGPAYPMGPVAYAVPSYAPGPAPAVSAAPAPQTAACGQWSWDQARAQYNWIAAPCAAPPAPVQVN